MGTFNTWITLLDKNNEEDEVMVYVEYDATYEPAYVTGLPENCYPDSSEMELTKITAIGKLPEGITQEMLTAEAEADNDRLTQLAWDDYFEKEHDD